jgi:hypothetical protein
MGDRKLRGPGGDALSLHGPPTTKVDGRSPYLSASEDLPSLSKIPGQVLDLFLPPSAPPGPDPIWGCRFLPSEGTAQSPLEADARADVGEAHPDPGTGRRPSDPRDTEALRTQYLSQANALRLQEIFSKMFRCGFHLLKCSLCGVFHFRPMKCNSRLCPFDARRRATERCAIYMGLVKKSKNPRFLTLTQPLIPYEDPDGLLLGVRRLRKAIARLIRRKIFRRVWGAIYSFEIVLRPGGFHLHAHMLLDALWVENRNEKGRPLEKAWKSCLEGVGTVFPESSNGRSVLWIVKCDAAAIAEVLKYTVKGASAHADGVGSEAPPEAGSSVHTGSKIHMEAQLRWDEVPYEGLKQLVSVVEGRVHLIEPIMGWRGEIKKFRKQEAEMTKQRAWELNFCHCGGELIPLTSGPWGDPRLVFVDGKHELREPAPGADLPDYWLRKKAE